MIRSRNKITMTTKVKKKKKENKQNNVESGTEKKIPEPKLNLLIDYFMLYSAFHESTEKQSRNGFTTRREVTRGRNGDGEGPTHSFTSFLQPRGSSRRENLYSKRVCGGREESK